jgi:hypothetical protein
VSDFYTTIVIQEPYWFFWRREVAYRGNCTVWHNVKTGKRATTHVECFLFDLWFKENRRR